MSYPPPPGLSSSSSNLPASLPARPPPSTAGQGHSKPPSSSGGFKPAFTAFAPRSVAQPNSYRTNSPAHYSAAPVASYSPAPQYPQTQGPTPPGAYQQQPQYDTYDGGAPQIRNPFVAAPGASDLSNLYSAPATYDPEYEAQIAQWQSAYVSKDGEKARPPGISAAAVAATPRTDSPSTKDAAPKTVQRAGGGTTWQDPSLLEWDPAHFRIFVGNLAGEVTDDSLLKAFSKYTSVQKARVIRDKRTTKSKGYGFVSFTSSDDYFQAAREMQGKYIGSHPVLLKRSTTEIKPTTVQDKNKKKGKGGGKVEHGGINKNKNGEKTKGGLKLLG
jgi:RNA recognition motif. (a.k.a. RRM, RBD, or RNP domain)